MSSDKMYITKIGELDHILGKPAPTKPFEPNAYDDNGDPIQLGLSNTTTSKPVREDKHRDKVGDKPVRKEKTYLNCAMHGITHWNCSTENRKIRGRGRPKGSQTSSKPVADQSQREGKHRKTLEYRPTPEEAIELAQEIGLKPQIRPCEKIERLDSAYFGSVFSELGEMADAINEIIDRGNETAEQINRMYGK